MPGATTPAAGGFPDTSVRHHHVRMVDGIFAILLVDAMGLGAAAGVAVATFAIGTALEGL